MQSLCVLGRQPKLGLAELESLFGADKLRPVGAGAAGLDVEPAGVNFSRLGGTVKFCKVLTVLNTTDWREIQKFLESSVPEHAADLPEGKMRLGLSVYGLEVSVNQINASALTLKKVIKKSGRSVRVVPNDELALNSAKVLHNQLTGALGWELIFVRDGQKTILAQNIAEQDIKAYAARDQKRPKRDSRVGMLPPKLAQIIVNLAVNQQEQAVNGKQLTVLDPFCGTGVILQEALLMGINTYGTDLEPRMVEYSAANLQWLSGQKFPACGDSLNFNFEVKTGDATSYKWPHKFNCIASETYLGRPFSAEPAPDVLAKVIQDANTIHKKFLSNLAGQIKPGFRLCLAVPAWHTKSGFKHLPVLDHLTDMGYTRLSFAHAKTEDLVYHREGQVVARELVVLKRK